MMRGSPDPSSFQVNVIVAVSPADSAVTWETVLEPSVLSLTLSL